jgi:hypothetical protein
MSVGFAVRSAPLNVADSRFDRGTFLLGRLEPGHGGAEGSRSGLATHGPRRLASASDHPLAGGGS